MTKRTQAEIDAEIAKLRACKRYVPRRTSFGDDNHKQIDLWIELLSGQLDTTSGEFEELDMDTQCTTLDAEQWRDGELDEPPSAGWDHFKPKAK